MTVGNLDDFVRHIVDEETPSIEVLVEPHKTWEQVDLAINELAIDDDLIARHDSDPRHCARRDHWLGVIERGAVIPPLLAVPLGSRLCLVDGYARFRALRAAGITTASVVRPVTRE
jgi:hypothetical protein